MSSDKDYFVSENLMRYVGEIDDEQKEQFYNDPNSGVRSNIMFPVDLGDLCRLHKTIRKRKCFTVLEFGLGFSTLVMADALLKNKQDFERLDTVPHIRCQNKFQVHSVDNDVKWVQSFKERLSNFPELNSVIFLCVTSVHATTFNGRLCHMYQKIPNVIPDFVYLDGPGTDNVLGDVNGCEFSECSDRTVMAADLCVIEPVLLPGCFIVVDGRTNNARFLKNNFQRNWAYTHLADEDVSIFELNEPPIGYLNKNRLTYCLG
jgi:hypothetical protein